MHLPHVNVSRINTSLDIHEHVQCSTPFLLGKVVSNETSERADGLSHLEYEGTYMNQESVVKLEEHAHGQTNVILKRGQAHKLHVDDFCPLFLIRVLHNSSLRKNSAPPWVILRDVSHVNNNVK